jgi:hypothetical protein
MKPKTKALAILALGLTAALLAARSQADVAAVGGVHLLIGGRYLQIDVNTAAPIIVYDGVYYQKTVEKVSMLAPVLKDVPQTTAVVIPPNTTEIMVNGANYPIEPEPVPRTIEVVTGTVQKTVYEPQTVETTVYVPLQTAAVTGAVYFMPANVATAWFELGGVTVVGEHRRPHYRACKPPTGVVVVNGVWRYRNGKTVMPLPRTPGRPPSVIVHPSYPYPHGGDKPGHRRGPEPDYKRNRDDGPGHHERR